MDIQLQLQAKRALDFLQGHPALTYPGTGTGAIVDGLDITMDPCDKRGHTEHEALWGVYLRGDDPLINSIPGALELVKKELARFPFEMDKDLISIHLPYETLYKEPWVYDHMEYCFEISFFVFKGNPYMFKHSYNALKWQCFNGMSGSAPSFDQMLVQAAQEVKAAYGDCDLDTFTTEEEKNLIVDDSVLNLRWLKYFIDTPFAKQHWQEFFPEWRKLINKIK